MADRIIALANILWRVGPPLVHTCPTWVTSSVTPQSDVSKRIPQPRAELSPLVREHEARLLSVMLRTSRLTWVFCETGTDSATLLKSGVMPLLQRRSGDRLAFASQPAERPADLDCSRQAANRRTRPRREAVIYFDTWGEAPLSLLKRNIDNVVLPGAGFNTSLSRGGLANALQCLNQQLGLHVVVVLNRFEEYLALPPEAGDVMQFAAEWVDAVANQELSVSFLVSMDEAARPQLERFRARLPGFDDNVLRLSPVSDAPGLSPELWPAIVRQGPSLPGEDRSAGVPTSLRHGDPAVGPPRRGPPPRVPVSVNDVYALIEATLSRTAADGQPSPRRAEAYTDASTAVPRARAAIPPGSATGGITVSGRFKSRR